jgi:hypothetical protein
MLNPVSPDNKIHVLHAAYDSSDNRAVIAVKLVGDEFRKQLCPSSQLHNEVKEEDTLVIGIDEAGKIEAVNSAATKDPVELSIHQITPLFDRLSKIFLKVDRQKPPTVANLQVDPEVNICCRPDMFLQALGWFTALIELSKLSFTKEPN